MADPKQTAHTPKFTAKVAEAIYERAFDSFWEGAGEAEKALWLAVAEDAIEATGHVKLVEALEAIAKKDPQGHTCGPSAPEVCENGCIGCIAEAALRAAKEK